MHLDFDLCLEGGILIAAPELNSTVFDRSIIYIYEHHNLGTKGIIVNKNLDEPDTNSLFDNINSEIGDIDYDLQALFGGPVEYTNGSLFYKEHNGKIKFSNNLITLKYIIDQELYNKSYLVFGYSSWLPGQLEQEMKDNYWVMMPNYMVSDDLIFNEEVDKKRIWQHSLHKLGIDNNRWITDDALIVQ